MDFPGSFTLAPGDQLFICGTPDAISLFYEEFLG